MVTSTTAESSAPAAAQCETHGYVFDPPLTTSLPVVAGTTTAAAITPSLRFPVRRIYCVGKNYADHVVEMGGDLKKSKPVFFTKPSFDGVVYAGPPPEAGSEESSSTTNVQYPPGTNNLHYEAELVVAIGKEVRCREKEESLPPDVLPTCVYGYAVGIDLTRRDLQGEAKSGGKPWDTGKYFDQSAPMGPLSIRPPNNESEEEQRDLYDKTMVLTVNGETKQSVRLGEMIWKVPEIIAELSLLYTLKPGDLIMTGTPSGVGPVVVGDRIRATIDGLVEGLDITLV